MALMRTNSGVTQVTSTADCSPFVSPPEAIATARRKTAITANTIKKYCHEKISGSIRNRTIKRSMSAIIAATTKRYVAGWILVSADASEAI